MKKISKISLFIIVFLIIVLTAIFFGSKPLINRLITEKIEDVRIGGIYKIKFKTAYFNIFQMGITIRQLELTPDSSSKSAKLFKYQKYLAEVQIKRININYINVFKFIKEQEISIRNIIIRKPIVQLYKNNHFSTARTKKPDKDNALSIKRIQLNDINIEDLELNVYIDDDRIIDLALGDVDLELVNPVIDFNLLNNPLKAISVGDILFSIHDIKYKDKKGLYETSLKLLEYIHSNQEILLEGFHLKPLYDNINFAKQFKYQSNRYDISFEDITLKNIDFKKLVKNKVIAIGQVNINELFFSAYRNKNYPVNKNFFPKLPQEALRNIKQKFEVNEILIKSSDILYTETAADASKAGKIEFTDLEMSIKNIGNTKAWQKNKKLTADAQTLVAGKGKLHINFDFPLNSNIFYIKGDLGILNMTALNTITEPNANIKIHSGTIQKMDFSARFNKNDSEGNMNLYYNDLDFSIFKEDSKSGEKHKRKLLSLVAKSFIIADANPDKKGEFHKADMAFERNKNKGLFVYIWKTILSGFRDTVRRKK